MAFQYCVATQNIASKLAPLNYIGYCAPILTSKVPWPNIARWTQKKHSNLWNQ
jgi:hypothetical protein